MNLGKVGPLRFREITHTPPVQKRIGLVRRVLEGPGGDVSTFIAATGCHAFLCIDQHPLFGDKINRPAEKTPEAILREAAQEKQAMGYWHNLTTCFLDEIGVFMFYEILGFGDVDLKVFTADNASQIYRIELNLISNVKDTKFTSSGGN